MKKRTANALTVSVLALALFSCNKPRNESQPNNNGNRNFLQYATGTQSTMTPQATSACKPPATNCAEVEGAVVVAKRKNDMMVVSTSGSSTDVGNFFNQAENADLTADLSTILAGKMKSGNYYMALNYCGGTVINFNFGTTYPVTLSNSEFTVQYAYSEQ